jgi:tetratricopeptide (TPR) repeat protein
MTVQFADNSEFLEAIALLVDLQLAICEDNEQRADALRDALDIPLNKLSWEANEWLRGLSGDLDMLCDQEVFEPNNLPEADYQRKLLAACQNIETAPEEVLALLRKEQHTVSADVVAYFRGRAYSLLSIHQVGTLFLRRASELSPTRIQYKVVLLGNLWSAGNLNQAQPLIKAIFDDEGANPNAVLLAASIMFQSVKSISPADRGSLGMLRQKVARVLRSPSLPAMVPAIASFGFIILGAISEILNRKSQARENYSRACDLMPGDAAPFLLRGRLMFKSDEQKALSDFRHAANLGVSDPLPYLILAREALKSGNYAEVHAMCMSAIQTGGPMVQGQAYEFMAIAETQMHGAIDLAQHYFNEARRLFPSDGNIQKNQALFEQARNQHTDNSTNSQAHSAKYKFELQAVDVTVQDTSAADQNDLLDLMLRTRTKQLWSEDNLVAAPSNTRFSIAA